MEVGEALHTRIVYTHLNTTAVLHINIHPRNPIRLAVYKHCTKPDIHLPRYVGICRSRETHNIIFAVGETDYVNKRYSCATCSVHMLLSATLPGFLLTQQVGMQPFGEISNAIMPGVQLINFNSGSPRPGLTSTLITGDASDELAWELLAIFESGRFPLPIYDHDSARRIVRYLLERGILDEEISDALEESCASMNNWLEKKGDKNMVGEWVIKWINASHESYLKRKFCRNTNSSGAKRWNGPLIEGCEPFQTRVLKNQGDGDDDDDDDGGRVEGMVADSEGGWNSYGMSCNTSCHTITCSASSSPSRSRKFAVRKNVSSISAKHLDLLRTAADNNNRWKSEKFLEFWNDDSCDSGVVLLETSPNSSLSIAPDDFRFCTSADVNPSRNCRESCACILSHYCRYGHVQPTGSRPEVTLHMRGYNLYSHDSSECCQPAHTDTICGSPATTSGSYYKNFEIRAVEFAMLDEDSGLRSGSGFLFVLIDEEFTGWTDIRRYRVSSSANPPERTLSNFLARNIDVSLVWKARIAEHVKIRLEIQSLLEKYRMHSCWFHCSLNSVFESVLAVVGGEMSEYHALTDIFDETNINNFNRLNTYVPILGTSDFS